MVLNIPFFPYHLLTPQQYTEYSSESCSLCQKDRGSGAPGREQPQVQPSSGDAAWLLQTHKFLIPVRHLPENQQGMSGCLEEPESGDWISQQEHKAKLDRWYPHGEKLPSKVALCKGEDVSWSPAKLCNQTVILYILLAYRTNSNTNQHSCQEQECRAVPKSPPRTIPSEGRHWHRELHSL